MFALGWQDKKLKAIISNCGTPERCPTDSVRKRHRMVDVGGENVDEVGEIRIKRPCMIEQFFRHFSAVDVHDHMRQGVLALEEHWSTNTWWRRIFATLPI